jgi:hypothetical protein
MAARPRNHIDGPILFEDRARSCLYEHSQKHAIKRHTSTASDKKGWHNGWRNVAPCYTLSRHGKKG